MWKYEKHKVLWEWFYCLSNLLMVGWLFGLYGISNFVGYLILNPFLYKYSVLFHIIQFRMSTLFNCQKQFYFKLFCFVKQFLFKQFSLV